jgi:hypothetical protein
LQATRAEFDSPALHDIGRRSGIGLGSKPGQRGSIPRQPAAESATSWSVTGLEHRGDLTVRGSIPPLSSAETTCMSVLHTRLLNGRASSPGSSTLPVSSAWPSCQMGRRRIATPARDGSIPSSASARTVVRAVRTRSSKPERRVRLSHGAQISGGPGARSFPCSSMEERPAANREMEIRFLPVRRKWR